MIAAGERYGAPLGWPAGVHRVTGLRDRYAQGASIRDLMEQTGRSYGWSYRLQR
ncbi:MAG: helix-turn-helix domain-containing protein [Pseudonocardiaceae bacterium]